ncbi:MAG: plastocyanin/azurin family copper-binding protein [Candidatus Nitrosocaldus sp.]|nr:plastocyanin/azurin family copper-binding protein [Candidatus Nitrosocaldus sp.]MDW8275605.1 plastocyanin/azurin family copper-binding protein [Candidatus Nitrosocaldus sp.]
MTTGEESHIIRTTGSRMGKGIALILIVMAVAGGLHVALGDFWHKYPPMNQVAKTGTTTTPAPTPAPAPSVPAGESRTFTFVFKEESPVKLHFEVDGQINPDIEVYVGDTITINVRNDGAMPHSFGIVSDPADLNSVVFNAAVGSSTQFLLAKQEGTVTFKPDKAGEYYYICLVAGHADLGMKGKFIVKERTTGAGGSTTGTGAGTGISEAGTTVASKVLSFSDSKVDLSFTFEEESPVKLHFTVNGEINPEIRVKAGSTVTIHIKNNGVMPHSFGIVSDPANVNSVVFNAAVGSSTQFLLAKQEGTVTFKPDKAGEYYYICLVAGHADLGMKGKFIVEQ